LKGALSKEIKQETKKIFQASETFYNIKNSKKVTYEENSVYVGCLSFEIRRNNGMYEIYCLQPNLEREDGFDRVLKETIPIKN
jgi:hypothetical protein